MPTQHPEDILIVRNINIDDPDFKDFFEVKWNGIIIRVPKGDIRRMPRYLAYHFNKHLTDRIIFRMDMAQFGRKMKTTRFRDKKLRDEIQRKIIIAVDQYYMADEGDAQAQLIKLYGQLNPDDSKDSLSLGTNEIPLEPPDIQDLKIDGATGNPILEELTPIANDAQGIGQIEADKVPLRRSKEELFAEAEELGIDIEASDTAETIQEKILAY